MTFTIGVFSPTRTEIPFINSIYIDFVINKRPIGMKVLWSPFSRVFITPQTDHEGIDTIHYISNGDFSWFQKIIQSITVT